MNSTPAASVIIPVYNDAERLALCLDRLAAQTFGADRFEVLVVDNGSTDPPHELIGRFGFCRLLEEAKPGSYAARNRALAEARGEVLAFTDSDCLPAERWLEEGVARVLEADGRIVVGGAIEVFAADESRPNAVELYDIAFGLQQASYVELFHYAATANLFTSRHVMDAVGPFDDQLKSSGDADWGRRAHAAGWPVVYEPNATVRHPARQSLSDILTKARRHAGGRIDYQKVRSDKPSFGHKLLTALKVVWPQAGHLWRGRAPLASRGYGFFSWLRMCSVGFAVQYAKAFEMIRTRLGGSSVRR